MKKLLIISYFFAPAAKIGAVRWTKLAKYLNATGKYDIDVITGDYECAEDKLLAADLDKVGNVIRIPHSDSRFGFVGAGGSNIIAKKAQSKISLVDRVKMLLKKNSFVLNAIQKKLSKQDYERSVDFCEEVKKHLGQNGGLSKYDAVISSFGPAADTLIAIWIKNNYPSVPLLMDFRDTMKIESLKKPYKKIYKDLQDEICGKADAVVLVTKGIGDSFDNISPEKPFEIITNGYDTDDFCSVSAEKSDKFLMSYTGTLYDGKANFTPLFKMLSELSSEGLIDLNDVEVRYAGVQFNQLYTQASTHNMQHILTDLGFIQREDAISLQHSSRILLLGTWNTTESHGFLSGKFLEYSASGTPIAAFISGNMGQSEMRSAIERGNFGAAYEEANKEADYVAMKQYILDEYNAFKNGTTTFAPVAEVISGFDYKNLASRYDELIERITK
ncbi:MAG: glycosyltransferase family 4 protein [Ruminococcaceae bacterium]|nr:glycosyltransferase family 4 protein [Oscillospiraceae bacterium]